MGRTLTNDGGRARRPMRLARCGVGVVSALLGGGILGVTVCHVGCVGAEFADGQFLCDPARGSDQCPDDQSCSQQGVCRSGNAGPDDAGPADTGPTDTGPTDTGPADTGPADTGPADTGAGDGCVALTCLDYLPSCAAALSDGCGQALDCSSQCPAPSTCGGGNVADQCGCPAVVSLTRAPYTVSTQIAGQLDLVWSAPDAALAQDGVAARTIHLPSGHYTDRLVLSNFQPTLPDGATLLGIVARIWLSTGDTQNGNAVIRSMTIDFERDASGGGIEHSLDLEGDRIWPDYYDNNTDVPLEFGSNNQLWQLDWPLEQVNSATLSLRIQGECTGGTPDTSTATARVDYAELVMYYRPACPSF